MLVEPSLDDLLEKVDNKFKLVTLALKRARQINDGSYVLVETDSVKPVSMALQEIHEGKVFIKEASDEVEEAHLDLDAALRMVEADEAIETIEHEEEAAIEKAAPQMEDADEDTDTVARMAAVMEEAHEEAAVEAAARELARSVQEEGSEEETEED